MNTLRIQIRFLVPLVLTFIVTAYLALPVMDQLTLRWFSRDSDLRGTVVTSALTNEIGRALADHNDAHLEALFSRAAQDERLVAIGLCSLDGVASVGATLVHPDGRVQHEGVAIIPMPVHLSRDVNYPVPDRWLASTRDSTAVTGACQIVRTSAWRALGGLDEAQAVGYNDVDFCLRLWVAG